MRPLETPDIEVLRSAQSRLQAGKEMILVTVARTWGSSPRPAGSLAAIGLDGEIFGSVSGGCIEENLVETICKDSNLTYPKVLRYGVSREEAGRFGLPCGGELVLVLERLVDEATIAPLLKQLKNRRQMVRRLHLDTGRVELYPATTGTPPLLWENRRLEKLFGPGWRLLIIGAGQLSRYVAQIALTLDYEVTICDPREEYTRSLQIPGVTLDRRMPDDAASALADDPCSAVMALTHDPKLDDMALMTALDSRAFYVGALGSRRTNAARRKRLATLGVSAKGLARLRGPIGLPIGSRTPAEIAVSIMAEVIAERRDVSLSPDPGTLQ